jgi:putative transposase
LRRIHGGGNLYFITTSCYQREPLLGGAGPRNIFLGIFEQVRKRYEFEVMGTVVMPEHVHVLISEPKRNTVPKVVQVLKQRVARRLLRNRKPSAQREL